MNKLLLQNYITLCQRFFETFDGGKFKPSLHQCSTAYPMSLI